jgi:hypothetical protein
MLSPCCLCVCISPSAFEWRNQSLGERGIVVGWGTVLQARKVAVSNPDVVIGFFDWSNPYSYIMALGSTQASRNEYQDSSCG